MSCIKDQHFSADGFMMWYGITKQAYYIETRAKNQLAYTT